MPLTHAERNIEALIRRLEALPVGSRLSVVREARGFRFYADEINRRSAMVTVAVASPPIIANPKLAIDIEQKLR